MDTAKNESIVFDNLLIGYNKNDKFPVITSKVNRSELIILLGRNGVGKSTLLRTIAGLQPPVGGMLNVMGKEISQYSQKEKASLISFVSTEKLNVSNLTVLGLVSLGRYSYTNWLGSLNSDDEYVIANAMRMAAISHLAEKNINEISDGELQRVMIARTLTQNTPIIILDEPTSFLDLPNKFEILLLLRNLAWNENKTIILSTHDLDIAMRVADNLWIMTKDSLKQGSPEDFALNKDFTDIFTNTEILYDYTNATIDIGVSLTKSIALEGNDNNTIFWLSKALNRLGYKISNNADTVIKATQNSFIYKKGGKEFSFTTVYDLSNFLKKKKD